MSAPSKIDVMKGISRIFGITLEESKEIVDLFYDNACYIVEKSYRKQLYTSILNYCWDEELFHKDKILECVAHGDLESAGEHLSLMNYYKTYRIDLMLDGELYYPESRDDVLYRLNVKNEE